MIQCRGPGFSLQSWQAKSLVQSLSCPPEQPQVTALSASLYSEEVYGCSRSDLLDHGGLQSVRGGTVCIGVNSPASLALHSGEGLNQTMHALFCQFPRRMDLQVSMSLGGGGST